MLACRAGFIGVLGKCFYVSHRKANYENSSKYCKSISAALAKVDREYVRNGLSRYLRYGAYWIGLKKYYEWYGSDGTALQMKTWKTTHPYVAIHPSKSILENVYGNSKYTGAVCQKYARKFFTCRES